MTRQVQRGEGPEHFRASTRPAQSSLISRIIKIMKKSLSSFLGILRPSKIQEKALERGRVTTDPTPDAAKIKRVASLRFERPSDNLEAVRIKFDSLKRHRGNESRVLEELDKCRSMLAKLPDSEEVQSLRLEIETFLAPVKQRSGSLSSLEKEQADLEKEYAHLLRDAGTMDAATWKFEIEKLKKSPGWERIASKSVEKRFQAQVEKIQAVIREKVQNFHRPSKKDIQEYEVVQKQMDIAQHKFDKEQAKITKKLVANEIEIEDVAAKIEKLKNREETDPALEKKLVKLKAKVAKKMEKLEPLEANLEQIRSEYQKLRSLVEQEFEFKQQISNYRHLFSDLEQLESGALHREVGVSFNENAGFERYKAFLATLGIKQEDLA